MSLGTIVVLAILAVMVFLDVRYLMKKKSSCGGSCGSCGSTNSSSSTCKWTENIERAKREISAQH